MTSRCRHRWLIGATATIALAACGESGSSSTAASTASSAASITVAAASDLRPAFETLAAEFTDDTGIDVTFSFGSSGLLSEQIINGAPFDMFASANVTFVDEVIDASRGIAATRTPYAFGRIVVWTAKNQRLPASIEELADPAYRRIAIANPQHAPYGQAAEQALRSAGVYETVVDRLVFGENVSDTFRLAESGNVDAAVVALSLAIADGSRPYLLLPAELHDPLEQALVVIDGPRVAAARRFAEYVSSDAGRAVMVSYGFVLPVDATPAGDS